MSVAISVACLVADWSASNVSFTYPGAQDYALRDVSFKLGQGQLCVSNDYLYSRLDVDIYAHASRLGDCRIKWLREVNDPEAHFPII